MRAKFLATACVAALCGPQMAFAQEGMSPAQGLDEIVVTAQRREQRLQDVPLAVTAIGAEQLQSQGINSLLDLGTGRVPGLSLNSVNGVETAIALNIRGFSPIDAAQGTMEQPVAVYIDGVPFARSQGISIDLITPERLEVLRGPQGQLFGRNAQAGALQIVTRRPSGLLGGEMSGTIGTFDTYALKGRIDLPEFAGFKVQIAGNFRRHGGYYRTPSNSNLQNVALWPGQNPAASFRFPVANYDQDLAQLRTYGGRAAVEYDSGPFNAYYSFDYSKARDDQGPAWFRNSPKGGTIFNPTGGTGPVSIFTNAGPGGTPLVFQDQPLGSKTPRSYFYSLPFVPFRTTAHGHMLNLSLDAGEGLTLKSITGSRYVRREGSSGQSGAVNPFLPTGYEYMRSRTFSQELQLIYEADRINFTAGGIYFRERVQDERESAFAGNCLVALGAAGAAGGAFCTPNGQASRPVFNTSVGGAGFKRSLSRTTAYGLYGQATYTPPILDDRLDIILGLRYSNDKKDGYRPIDFGLNPTTGVVDLRNQFKTDRVDPAVSVKYKFNNDVSVYARYAVGYRDGGSSVRSPTFTSFSDDELKSFELGLKSEFLDRRVRLNIAAFLNRVTGEQVSIQSDPSRTPALSDTFNNPARKKVKGVEAELGLRVTNTLRLSGSYSFLDASSAFIGLDAVGVNQPINAFLPGIVSATETTGIIVDAATRAAHPNSTIVKIGATGAPRHSGSVMVDWEKDVGMGRLSLHGEWSGATTMIVSPIIYQTIVINGVGTAQPRWNPGFDFSRFNANATLSEVRLGQVEAQFRIWMKNIFNRANPSYSFAAGNSLNAASPRPNSIMYLLPPRTMGLDVSLRF